MTLAEPLTVFAIEKIVEISGHPFCLFTMRPHSKRAPKFLQALFYFKENKQSTTKESDLFSQKTPI